MLTTPVCVDVSHISLPFVFFRLTNRCLEWIWTLLVLQWHSGHLVPPWAAGWHPPPVRPSAPSSGSKWMREDGVQGAPHPSISPLLLHPPHAPRVLFIYCHFSPLSLSNNYYSGEHRFNLPCALINWARVRRVRDWQLWPSYLQLFFSSIYIYNFFIFWGGGSKYISATRKLLDQLYRLLIYLYQINSES